MMIHMLVFITLPILISGNCLIFDKKFGCLMCRSGFYNSDMDGAEYFKIENCIPKQDNSSFVGRTVFVASDSFDFESLSLSNESNIIYENLQEAFRQEDLLSLVISDMMVKKITFKLMKGNHYILPRDARGSLRTGGYFIRNNVEVTISPLLCNESSPGLNEFCNSFDSYPVVYLKDPTFKLFISNKFIINNIIINGVDWHLEENADPCSNVRKTCCSSPIPNCLQKLSYSYSAGGRTILGLFNLEPIIDAFNPVVPEITFFNVNFENLVIIGFEGSMAGSKLGASLFILFELPGSIKLVNCSLNKVFFPEGLIQKSSYFRGIYDYIASTINTTNFSKLTSIIFLENCSISEYNFLKIKILYEIGYENVRNSSLFKLINFKGVFYMGSSQITRASLPKDGVIFSLNEKNLENKGIFLLSNNLMLGNTFLFFVFMKDSYFRCCLSATVSDNNFINTEFTNFIDLSHIGNFTLQGTFSEKFLIPQISFIKAAYSVLTLTNSLYSGLFNSVPYHLIQIGSVYKVTYQTIFDESRSSKGIFSSNETTIFKGLTLSKSNMLLFSNINVNFRLSLEDCVFEIIDLTLPTYKEKSSFIELYSEGLFSINNVLFDRIKTLIKIIELIYYLNANINRLFVRNVIILDNYFIYYASSTKCNPSDHQLNLTSVELRMVQIDFTFENFGKFRLGLFYLHTTDTDKGPAIRINNFTLQDIFYETQHIKQIILYISGYNARISLFQGVNISNGVLMLFSIKSTAGDITVDNFIFNNTIDYPMIRFVDCGLTYFTRFELKNSSFYSGNMAPGKALALNLAQRVLLRNFTIEVLLESGIVVFAQPNRTSFIDIENITIRCLRGSEANLVMIITDNKETSLDSSNISRIAENIEKGLFNFGFKNCLFESSYESAIILMVRSQLLFKNCLFRDVNGMEGGLLRIGQGSTAILYGVNSSNCHADSRGGCFSIEDSELIIFSSNFAFCSSKTTGGALNAVESNITLINSQIFNSYSRSGGVIFIDLSRLYLNQTIFRFASTDKFGAFIASKQGFLNISSCEFKKGTAGLFGGVMYFEGTVFLIKSSSLANCSSKLGTIYAVSGGGNISEIENVIAQHNSAEIDGGALYLKDVNIKIRLLEILNTSVKGFLMIHFGDFLSPTLVIESIRIMGSGECEGIFNLNDAEMVFENSYINKTIQERGNIFLLKKSRLIIKSSFVTQTPSQESKIPRPILFIYAKLSNISLITCLFDMKNSSSFIFCLKCKNITAFNSFFHGGSSRQGSVFEVAESAIFGNYTAFVNNYASTGGVIYSLQSDLFLLNALFFENKANLTGSNIFSYNFDQGEIRVMSIVNSLFMNIKSTGINSTLVTIKIISSVFFGNHSGEENQALYVKNSPSITLANLYLQYFSNASPIFIQTQGLGTPISNLTVLNSTFSHSLFRQGNGGFIAVHGRISVNVSNSLFAHGEADNGGAIYINCLSLTGCEVLFSECIFYSNYGLHSGGAISSNILGVKYEGSTFKFNRAQVGDVIYFYPSKLKFFKSSNANIDLRGVILELLRNNSQSVDLLETLDNFTNVVPGYPFLLGFAILDEAENLQIFENNTMASINITDVFRKDGNSTYTMEKPFFSQNHGNITEGIGVFNFSLGGHAGTIIAARVTYANKNIKLNQNIYIELLECNHGDSFQDLKCLRCPANFYLLGDSEENKTCKSCPENAECPGGDIIIPNKNFWRKDYASPLIFKCNLKHGCPTQTISLFERGPYQFACSEGYEDNLCQACSQGYGTVGEECVLCSSSNSIFILLVVSGYSIYLVFIYLEEKSVSDNDSHFRASLMKILLSHMSIFILLTSLKVAWSDFFKSFMIISSFYVTTSPSTITSVECFFEWDKHDRFFYVIILWGLAPIFLSVLTLLKNIILNFIFLIFKKSYSSRFCDSMRIHLKINWLFLEVFKFITIVFINIYPSLLLNMFKVFGCKSLDLSSTKYLSQAPWVACDSEFHKKTRNISLAFIFFWAVVFPLFLFILTKRTFKTYFSQNKITFEWDNSCADKNIFGKYCKKMELQNKKFVVKYLLQGYKKKYFWWEIVVFFRKLLFFSVASFSEEMDAISIGGLALLVLTTFMMMTLFLQPYQTPSINSLEVFSHLISIISIAMGLITSFGHDISKTLEQSCMFCLLFLNILFFLIWISCYFEIFLLAVANRTKLMVQQIKALRKKA